jgi:hypothetical protein
MQLITDHPAVFARFRGSASRGFFRDALQLLHDYAITEQAIRELEIPRLLDEVRLFARAYEPQLRRQILIPDAATEQLPHVSTDARAAYRLRHYDMLEDYARCLQLLDMFAVCASLDDITPELAAWVRSHVSSPSFADRIRRHFTPEVYS